MRLIKHLNVFRHIRRNERRKSMTKQEIIEAIAKEAEASGAAEDDTKA